MIDRFALTERVAVVTGAGTGIGRAIAVALAESGAHVVVTGRRPEPLAALAREFPEHILDCPADVTHEHTLEAAAQAAVKRWGALHIWVNNAGILERGVLPETGADNLERQWKVNVEGVWNGCRVAVRHLQATGGVIINVSSYLSLHAGANAGIPAYTATKGAVSALTRSLAVRHGPEGIRVNAVCPAFVPTELNRASWEASGANDPKFAERYPLKRVGTPDDVASAVVFLAGDGASWITGQELVVDGGISAV